MFLLQCIRRQTNNVLSDISEYNSYRTLPVEACLAVDIQSNEMQLTAAITLKRTWRDSRVETMRKTYTVLKSAQEIQHT